MQYIPVIQEWIKLAMEVFPFILLFIKWKDVKEIFCEKGGGMSSKRVIAIMGMITLCRLAIVTQASDKDGAVDNNILLALTFIILLAAAIATAPQILDLFGKIKGVGTKSLIETKDTTVIDKTETNKTT